MKKLMAIITSTLFISFTAVAAVAAEPRYSEEYLDGVCGGGYAHNQGPWPLINLEKR